MIVFRLLQICVWAPVLLAAADIDSDAVDAGRLEEDTLRLETEVKQPLEAAARRRKKLPKPPSSGKGGKGSEPDKPSGRRRNKGGKGSRRRRRRKSSKGCTPYRTNDCRCKESLDSCPAPCKASKKCSVCNVWNDIIKEHDDGKKAQFGHGFPDPWVLVASHQCHYFHHCKPVLDEYGDIDPEKMPGGPFKDAKYMAVPYGHKCSGDPADGWGNLEKCSSWKQCFQKCLDNNNKYGKKADRQCNLVHYEVESGRCTKFATKECKGKDGKYATTKADGFIVMKAYMDEQRHSDTKPAEKENQEAAEQMQPSDQSAAVDQ